MAEEKIIAKVFRYDPSVDAEPTYNTYEVPWKELITGLEVLVYINENYEAIEFDSCCRSSLCGRCSMMINGTPGLACWTALEPGEVTFEPLRGFPVIRDLITDHSKVMVKMVDAGLAVETNEEITKLPNIPYDMWVNTFEPLNLCKECMCCYAACPIIYEKKDFESFIGPAALVQIGMRFFDPKDKSDRAAQAAFNGLFECSLCGDCSEVCPAYIDHVSIIKAMMEAATEAGLEPA
jgi:succinate dehydrogenase/fumarate reductase iron-sulfur protein